MNPAKVDFHGRKGDKKFSFNFFYQIVAKPHFVQIYDFAL